MFAEEKLETFGLREAPQNNAMFNLGGIVLAKHFQVMNSLL